MSEDFREKIKSLNFSTGGPKTKVVKDDLGNTVTEHDDGRKDVVVRPKTVQVITRVNGDSDGS